MKLEGYIFFAYFASLCLLFINIVFLRKVYKNVKRYTLYLWAVRILGILPGFAGVIWGITIYVKKQNIDGFIIMTPWLILEAGSLQILIFMNELVKNSKKNS